MNTILWKEIYNLFVDDCRLNRVDIARAVEPAIIFAKTEQKMLEKTYEILESKDNPEEITLKNKIKEHLDKLKDLDNVNTSHVY